MITDSHATDSTDNYEPWLKAVAAARESHPDEMSWNDLLSAYALIGVKTTQTPAQVEAGTWNLETLGFVDRARGAITIPDRVVWDADLEGW